MIEDIKDRIEKLIDSEQLTSSKFAEIIGVQRATISHVVNGRNQPSLDLVRKVLISFSTLSSEWLLFGRGPMYKDGKKGQVLFDETESDDSEELKEKLEEQTDEKSSDNSKKQEEKKKSNTNSSDETQAEQTNSETPPQKTVPTADDEIIPEVEKIIILNNDKTFTEYRKR
jgi:transcriptional regulator with XRE-family HTH domain